MNKNINVEELALELNGIKDTLVLVSGQFANKDAHCKWDNETISGTLNSLAMHIERIGNDLCDYSCNAIAENLQKTMGNISGPIPAELWEKLTADENAFLTIDEKENA